MVKVHLIGDFLRPCVEMERIECDALVNVERPMRAIPQGRQSFAGDRKWTWGWRLSRPVNNVTESATEKTTQVPLTCKATSTNGPSAGVESKEERCSILFNKSKLNTKLIQCKHSFAGCIYSNWGRYSSGKNTKKVQCSQQQILVCWVHDNQAKRV